MADIKNASWTVPAAVLALALSASACCGKPWRAFPDMPGPPDASYRTGSVHGYDVYVWECIDGKRTVIYQYSAEMTCRRAEMQTASCGGITSIEKELEQAEKATVPDSMAWPR